MSNIEKDKNFIVDITDMTHEGQGVGKIDGFTVFVDGTLPGEQVELKITKLKKSYAVGEIVKILKPSPFRTTPFCGAFGRCGGCSLQHMDYRAQLAFKTKLVRDSIVRIGGLKDIAVHDAIGMENPLRYRNKAQYPVVKVDGGIAAGFYASRSHEVVQSAECGIQDKASDIIRRAVVDFMVEKGISAYNEITCTGLVRHIVTRVGFRTGEIMVVLVINGDDLPSRDELVRRLIGTVESAVKPAGIGDAGLLSGGSGGNGGTGDISGNGVIGGSGCVGDKGGICANIGAGATDDAGDALYNETEVLGALQGRTSTNRIVHAAGATCDTGIDTASGALYYTSAVPISETIHGAGTHNTPAVPAAGTYCGTAADHDSVADRASAAVRHASAAVPPAGTYCNAAADHDSVADHASAAVRHASAAVPPAGISCGAGACSGEAAFVKLFSGKSSDYAVKSIYLNINTENTNVIMGNKNKLIYGHETITDIIGGCRFMISPASFFQVNPVQTEALYSKVLEYAGLSGTETVFDLYCGTGTISIFLSRKARKVYGVEVVKEAVDNARKNASLNGACNVEFIEGEAEKAVPGLYDQGIRADVVVLDPPRKGCDESLLRLLTDMKPARIVYVSCNPATLARDLKFLDVHGYRVAEVQPVDMFPWTGHVECVVSLKRKHSE